MPVSVAVTPHVLKVGISATVVFSLHVFICACTLLAGKGIICMIIEEEGWIHTANGGKSRLEHFLPEILLTGHFVYF